MSLLPIIPDEEASPDAKVIFDHSKIMFGRVANAVRVASHTPKIAQSLFSFIVSGLREEISNVLNKRTKCLVILKTSTLNGCKYWTGHNVTLGRALGFSEEMIAAVSGDYQNSEHFSASEKAAMKWAEVMTEKQYQGSPGKSPEHREALEQLKKYYNNEQIVEIAFTSGFFNFWNRFTDSFEIDIEDNPVMALFEKSTTINPDDYVAYMRDCWWNLK
jgi:alkylhydroperoxidase family enzyme